ncbi:MAG: Division initiation protein, partial [Clostridiales bacterium 38_11]
PPIEIKAIGNTQTLESVLNFKGGTVWEMKNLNYQVDISILDEIEIQRQIKLIEFRYAQPY